MIYELLDLTLILHMTFSPHGKIQSIEMFLFIIREQENRICHKLTCMLGFQKR